VSELRGQVIGRALVLDRGGHATDAWRGERLSDAGPILDARAKTEYKRRLADLRRDLEEAEQFNDSDRAERAREEMNAIAEQVASAVGLGGRNRRIGSEAERARSAVTKRIKDSINKIGEALPSLRRHLAARVKTGYFCSYNPNPERPVAWKF
jgi:non-specific serine/threonine protein kinase